jgi:hypothetical protein
MADQHAAANQRYSNMMSPAREARRWLSKAGFHPARRVTYPSRRAQQCLVVCLALRSRYERLFRAVRNDDPAAVLQAGLELIFDVLTLTELLGLPTNRAWPIIAHSVFSKLEPHVIADDLGMILPSLDYIDPRDGIAALLSTARWGTPVVPAPAPSEPLPAQRQPRKAKDRGGRRTDTAAG